MQSRRLREIPTVQFTAALAIRNCAPVTGIKLVLLLHILLS